MNWLKETGMIHLKEDEKEGITWFFFFSEIAKMIQQINLLQSQTDVLYEQNEALRMRLGMGPNESLDLEEV